MTDTQPLYVIKKDTKRPSGVVPATRTEDLDWIRHLHLRWATSFDLRDTLPRLDVLMSA